MKLLVYTCIFENYDWVFPPIQPESNLTYVIVTDNPNLKAPDWQTIVVETGQFRNAKTANLYHRALSHRMFQEYDYSLYIDGNIRLIGRISDFFEKFLDYDAALGLFPHPLRSTVRDEADICCDVGKVTEFDRLEAELSYYKQKGFQDDKGLIETTIILKNHQHPDLDQAMELWWNLFERFGTRDQISLPYVLWKTDASCMYHAFSFRDPNPFFGLYTHRGDKRAPQHFSYVEGRAYDSFFYGVILRLWHFSWSIRRVFRRLTKALLQMQ